MNDINCYLPKISLRERQLKWRNDVRNKGFTNIYRWYGYGIMVEAR